MFESHGGVKRPQPSGASAERDVKIEQLLLSGLDHYFKGRYERAIDVWTRVLFLDRMHARARAYIDRARAATAASCPPTPAAPATPPSTRAGTAPITGR